MDRPRRLWQRRRLRVAVALAAVIATVAAAPFLFTTSIVRYYLSHSDYAQFNITIESASLSPVGRLVLRNVVIHDIREHAGKPLVSFSTARIDFSWGQVRQNHLKIVDIQGLRLNVRRAADAPISLLRLTDPAPAAPAPAGASAAAAGNPFWFDQLIITGGVQVEGFEPWTQLIPETMRTELPLRIHGQSTGDTRWPTRELAIVCGDPDSSDLTPALAAKLTVKPDSAGNVDLTVSNFSVRHVSVSLTPELLTQLLPAFASLPADLRRRYELSVDTLQFAGRISLAADAKLAGEVSLRNMDLVARSDGMPLSLDTLSLSARVELPLNADAAKDIRVSGATFGFDAIQYGGWRLARGSANFEVSDGIFTLAQSQAAFADGAIICSVDWPLNSALPSRGSASLRDANVTQILARLPDELRKDIPINVTGLASAKLTFANENLPSFTGRVEISTGDNFRIEYPASPALGPVTLANTTVAGQFFWSGNAGEFPEITRGRLRADTVTIASVDFTDISAGLQFRDNTIVVDTLRATVGEHGALDADARFDLATGTIEAASLNAESIPLSYAERWLPSTMKIEAAANISATLSHPDNAASYALSTTVAVTDAATLHCNDGKITTSGPITLTLAAQFDADFRSNMAVTAIFTTPRAVTLDDALLAQYTSLKFKDGLSVSLERLTVSGKIPTDMSLFTGKVELTNLAASAAFDDASALSLQNLTFTTPIEVPLTAPNFTAILNSARITPATLDFDRLTYGKNFIEDFTSTLALNKGRLSVAPGTHFTFAGGNVAATAEIDLLTPSLTAANFILTKIDQASVSRTLLPERFSADGPASGEITFIRNERNQLVGSITLTGDSPGRLMLDREMSQKLLAPAIKAAAVGGTTVIPPTFDQIVVGQLANYAYSSGKITARDIGGDVELRLDYTHAPLTAADPGYHVKMKIAGVDEVVNYPVHLPGLSFMLRRMTVADIMLQSFGFVDVIVKPLIQTTQPATQAGTQPGTQPTSQPATQPTSMPATRPASNAANGAVPATQRTPATVPATRPGT